jgi:hypothetical protein
MAYKTKTKRRQYRKKNTTHVKRRKYGSYVGIGGDNNTQATKPTVGSNMSMLGSVISQGLNNITSGVIKTGARLLVPNVDTEKPISDVLKESKDEISKVADVLQSPVGDELVKEASVVGEKLVDAVEKPLEEIGDKGMEYLGKQIPVVEDMAKTTLFGLPVIGSAAAATEDALDVVQGIENTVATGLDMFQEGEQMVVNLKQPVEEASNLYSTYKSAVNSVNEGASGLASSASGLASSASGLASSASGLASNAINKEVNNVTGQIQNQAQNHSKNIKNIQNAGKMIGGRTMKSQVEFFSPFVNKSKILKMYGGNKTRKLIRNKRRIR